MDEGNNDYVRQKSKQRKEALCFSFALFNRPGHRTQEFHNAPRDIGSVGSYRRNFL
jgi:hypothetical protein